MDSKKNKINRCHLFYTKPGYKILTACEKNYKYYLRRLGPNLFWFACFLVCLYKNKVYQENCF